jgi:hypothetical protein
MDQASAPSSKIILHCLPRGGEAIEALGGQGPVVLCAPGVQAVDFATRLYPDRRVEVKAEYADPQIKPGLLSLPLFLMGLKKTDESPEKLKARVVACATRLIGVSKSDGEAVLLGGPILISLLSFKLVSIGYRGPFLDGVKPGSRRVFEYQA